MNPGAPVRLSLVLPVGNLRELLAASQVVLFILVEARVELDLLRGRGAPPQALTPGRPGAILFVAAHLGWAASDADLTARYERGLRARIERYYARQGIGAVPYDLQLL